MIQRFDQIAVDLPEPSGPNPAAAAAIQELMGGKFGEMSTLMNYTFQSFNFRGKEKYSTILSATLRPRNTATSRQ
jgi:Mn-containing catalase